MNRNVGQGRKIIRHSIVASIPACHAGDRGSIPRVGAHFCFAPPRQLDHEYLKKILYID
jgi:hypothetical protein